MNTYSNPKAGSNLAIGEVLYDHCCVTRTMLAHVDVQYLGKILGGYDLHLHEKDEVYVSIVIYMYVFVIRRMRTWMVNH